MIKLIIADDHVVLREALAEMLESKGEFTISAQASNGEELLNKLENCPADIILMDVIMPGMDGLEVLKKVQDRPSTPPILIFSSDEGQGNIRAAMNSGARGFIPKNADVQELQYAIKSILQGNTYLSPAITGKLMQNGAHENMMQDPLEVLSKREQEVMKHLAEGKPNREIGKILHISIRTVDTHRSNILKKLGVKTNAELVKLAISNRMVKI